MLIPFYLICLLIYIALLVKYIVLEQWGKEVPAALTARTNFLKINFISYQFHTLTGKLRNGRAFGNKVLSKHNDKQLSVLYLENFPAIHCIKLLLNLRFRQMTIIGIFLIAFFFAGITNSDIGTSAPKAPPQKTIATPTPSVTPSTLPKGSIIGEHPDASVSSAPAPSQPLTPQQTIEKAIEETQKLDLPSEQKEKILEMLRKRMEEDAARGQR